MQYRIQYRILNRSWKCMISYTILHTISDTISYTTWNHTFTFDMWLGLIRPLSSRCSLRAASAFVLWLFLCADKERLYLFCLVHRGDKYKQDIALCHTWLPLPPQHRPKQAGVECSAQANEIASVSKTDVYILWTQFVQVCNNVIHGAMVEIKPPFSQPILVRLGAGGCLENR